jgi:hypothetical protein
VSTMPDDAERDAVMAPLLPFQRQLVSELLGENGLCIMSAGLGWQKVLCVRCLDQKAKKCWHELGLCSLERTTYA